MSSSKQNHFPVHFGDIAARTLRGVVLNKFDLYSSQFCEMSSSDSPHANRIPIALENSGLESPRETKQG